MNSDKRLAECYQPLFDLIKLEYKIAPLISEMDEIIEAVKAVQDNRRNYYDWIKLNQEALRKMERIKK